jgi:hypothetical protein
MSMPPMTNLLIRMPTSDAERYEKICTINA